MMQTALDPPTSSSPPPPSTPASQRLESDPSRTGTLWIGATGVALLLAAAAVLTAVRWGDIGQTAKLGGFVAITLTMLFGGRRAQSVIPLTGRAIFHLGALLIPLDMAAVAVLAERTWQETLLLTSLTAIASWYALQRVDPSPVLQWAARSSVPLGAAGVAAVSPLSMPLVLAVVAAVAVAVTVLSTGFEAIFGRPTGRSATMWTLLSGLLPVAAFQEWPLQLAGTVGDLGFVAADRTGLIAAALLATVVATVHARFQPSLERGWMVVVLAAAAAVTAGSMFATSHVWILSCALLFVVIEGVALAVRREPLWSPIVDVVAPLAEAASIFVALVALVDAAWAPAPSLAIAGVALVIGWLTADIRRVLEPNDWVVGLIYGSGWEPATFAVPLAASVLPVALGAPSWVLAAVLVAGLAWTVLTMRPFGVAVGASCALLAQLIAVNASPRYWVSIAVAGVAALIIAVGARLQLRRSNAEAGAVVAALASVFAVLPWVSLETLYGPGVATLAVAVLAWSLGWVVSRRVDVAAALIPRAIASVSLVGAWLLNPVPAIVLCAVIAVLAAFDAWRLRNWPISAVSFVAVGLLVIPVGALLGLSTPAAGTLLTATALMFVGVSAGLPKLAEIPVGTAAIVLTCLGVAMASEVAEFLTPAIMLAGASTILVGTLKRITPVVGLGALLVVIGTWMQLALWEVMWVEAYLALPALVAVWAGSRWHRAGASSWVAFAPTVAIVGGVAAIDRFTGGSAWHAVIAGGIAVVAILAGGLWRLIGPLVTGTALIAAVTIYESLGPGSRVPTWGWLALGGSILLAAAVQMERSETTPLEHGQRLVHVLNTRFS